MGKFLLSLSVLEELVFVLGRVCVFMLLTDMFKKKKEKE